MVFPQYRRTLSQYLLISTYELQTFFKNDNEIKNVIQKYTL